jgi:Domain of unknown function (DUF4340)
MARGVWVHVGLLIVAGAASVYVWTRDPKASAAPLADVTIWRGRSEDVQRITFESAVRRISLESRTDAQGRWFFGTEQLVVAISPDAGTPAAPKTTSFASTTAGQKIAQALAPFKALREVGRVESARAGEFGFKEPAPSMTAVVAGKEHHLTMGGATPGGGDRYVRDDASGIVYAVKSDFVRDLESGEAALLERDVHDFQDADVASVRIVGGGKTREVLRRGPTTKRVWADPSSPESAEETVSNWLSKVDRLRPAEYAGDTPARSEPVMRLEYKIKGAEGVFLELAKVPATSGKPDYFVRSEHTRLWAKVHQPWAEQVEQDLASVLK